MMLEESCGTKGIKHTDVLLSENYQIQSCNSNSSPSLIISLQQHNTQGFIPNQLHHLWEIVNVLCFPCFSTLYHALIKPFMQQVKCSKQEKHYSAVQQD